MDHFSVASPGSREEASRSLPITRRTDQVSDAVRNTTKWMECPQSPACGQQLWKRDMSAQCWLYVGSPSATVAQHKASIGSTSRLQDANLTPRIAVSLPGKSKQTLRPSTVNKNILPLRVIETLTPQGVRQHPSCVGGGGGGTRHLDTGYIYRGGGVFTGDILCRNLGSGKTHHISRTELSERDTRFCRNPLHRDIRKNI